MADDDRAPPHALELYEALRAAPYDFDFFQAIRRIDAANKEKPRLGESPHLADDPVRLGQIPSLIFAPATMASFEPAADGRAARLSSYFFGIFGPSGALPIHLTEYARDRIRNSGDRTFARFVDIFHHRMLSLFYRAWAASQPAVSFDRPGNDRFAAYVASLFGLGLPSLRDRDAMPDLAKLHFAGRLANQTRNAEGLRAMIADYFKLPVEIEQFVGDRPRPARSARPPRSATASMFITTSSAFSSARSASPTISGSCPAASASGASCRSCATMSATSSPGTST
jgi:type VI secretion system protein ImpH